MLSGPFCIRARWDNPTLLCPFVGLDLAWAARSSLAGRQWFLAKLRRTVPSLSRQGTPAVSSWTISSGRPFLAALLFADVAGRLLFQSCCLTSQFELGAWRVVLNVVAQIVPAWQCLASDVHLAACRGERGEHHQASKKYCRTAFRFLRRQICHLSLLLPEGLRPMHIIGQHNPYRPPSRQTFAQPQSFSPWCRLLAAPALHQG